VSKTESEQLKPYSTYNVFEDKFTLVLNRGKFNSLDCWNQVLNERKPYTKKHQIPLCFYRPKKISLL